MAKVHERTLARQMAVQALYMCMLIEQPTTYALVPDCELPDMGHLPAYSKLLLEGVGTYGESIDEKLAEASQNWSVGRMPVVDHAILLLACYEMLYEQGIPVSVCINEAVELAKAFGGEDDSARFVNGLLGYIARTYCADRIYEKDSSCEVVEA